MDESLVINVVAPDSSSTSTHPTAQTRLPASLNWKRKRALVKRQRKQEALLPAQTIPSGELTFGGGQHMHSSRLTRLLGVTTTEPQEGVLSLMPASGNTVNQQSSNHAKPLKSSTLQPTEGKPREFISSLFSANPEVDEKGAEIKQKLKDETHAPVSTLPVFSDTSFKGLGLHPVLVNHLISKLGMSAPTPIQRTTLPALLGTHQDAIVQAQTGSGKTLAFLLPIIHRLLLASRELNDASGNADETAQLNRNLGTLAIILVPTRELAKQIKSVLDSLLNYTPSHEEKSASSTDAQIDAHSLKHWIVSGLIVGGEKKKSEKARLRKGLSLLVSTPGRLLDHLKTTRSFETCNLRWLVLDEADKLLELGFEQTLKEIISILDARRVQVMGAKSTSSLTVRRAKVGAWPATRQNILVSATIQDGVKKLAEEALNDPLFINANKKKKDKSSAQEAASLSLMEEVKLIVPEQLSQSYAIVPAKLRLVSLLALLQIKCRKAPRKVIVFLSCRDSVDFIHHVFTLAHGGREDSDRDESAPSSQKPFLPESVGLFKLHGSLSQPERTKAYDGFVRSNGVSILFCTDVAARGLDLPDVTDVVQYDPPADVKDYVHRIGRTARLGKDGHAVLFLLPSEVEYLSLLTQHHLRIQEKSVTTWLAGLENPNRPTLLPRPGQKGGVARKGYELVATDIHMAFERFIMNDHENLTLAKRTFKSHIRAYATHVSAERHIFHVKNLHLGHIAKSFGLREAPSSVGNDPSIRQSVGKGGAQRGKGGRDGSKSLYAKKESCYNTQDAPKSLKRKALDLVKFGAVSEFGDGNVKDVMKKFSKKSRN